MKIMDQKFKVLFGAMCALWCGLCISNEAFGQTLPDGKGKAEFVHNCTACHRADMVVRVKKTPDDWRKSVDEMAARGTDGSKEDLDNVALYLDTYFAIDKPGPTAATSSSTSGGAAVLNSSEIEGAKRVIAENACLTCHRVEQQGSYSGPTLNGMGARRTTDEIRTAIVRPSPTVDPSNNLIRLTTGDGKTLAGRILSQDDHQVRVIDASGEVTSYSKAGLRQLTIINTNPMPSYERKITGEDLDGLVRYLDSLSSVDDSVRK
jgi:putative heme-binding domain-containing protein